MIRRILFLVILVSSIAILSVACRPVPLPTPTPEPPTATLAPTATPAPSATPAPLEVWAANAYTLAHFRPQDRFVVYFGQPMDPNSTPNPLLFFPVVHGRFSWDQAHTSVAFIPEEGFDPGQTYFVILNDLLISVGNRSFDRSFEWKLQVLPVPQVLTRPASRRTEADRSPVFELAFDRPMNTSSVAAALNVSPTIPLNLSWSGEAQASQLTVTAARPLNPGDSYQFTLQPAAASSDGVQLGSAVQWSADLAPLVLRTIRQGNRNNAPIRVEFNYAMDTHSTGAILHFDPPLTGRWGWNRAGTAAVFTPTVPLQSGTQYTLSFSGFPLDDRGDLIVPPAPWHFTTSPAILSATPNALKTQPTAPIQVTFDRLMDVQKTALALRIEPPTDGTIQWQETTLTFRPTGGYLMEQTTYTVTIGVEACGLDGEPILNQPYTWSFRTADLQDIANFGYGPNAQVLDADGRRAVQFQIFQRYSQPITFQLYQLNLEQFLDRYSSGFRGVAGWEKRPLKTSGAPLLTSWQVEPASSKNQYLDMQEVIIPANVPPGLYILNMVAGHLNDQLILVLTRHTLMVKEAEGQLVVWDSDINGRPLPGSEVGIYARDGTRVAEGSTDEQGVYRATIARDPEPLIVVSRRGDDVTANGLSSEWQTGGWWGWWWNAPVAQQYAVYIDTDRPIYRPGQSVLFKAILRQDDDAALSLPPSGTPVTVRIRDARNNVVQTLSLSTNDWGSVNGQFDLAEGAMLGDYTVEIVMGDPRFSQETHRQTFQVQDYRKPDYQVTVTTNATHYVAGDTITVRADSRYFFGEPVAGAKLTVRLFRGQESYWWDQSEGKYTWYGGDAPYTTATADANGLFTLTLPAKMDAFSSDTDWWWMGSSLRRSTQAVEVTADDGSNQVVSGMAVFHVLNAADKLSLDIGSYFHKPGQPFTVRARLLSLDDQPVGGKNLRLELRRYSASAYGYTHVIQSAEMTTGDDGWAQVALTVQEPGFYMLRINGQDRQGRAIYATGWLYALSNDRSGWYGYGGSDFRISADRDSYAPGETARLLIETPFSGPALLTWERGRTRREQLVELTAPVTVIDVPVQADDVPNVYVVVNAWQPRDTTLTENVWQSLSDSQLRTASINLKVPAVGKKLNIAILPDQTTYAPRQEAVITLRVTDEQGQPVSAEVSLAMVDEAIFALSGELVGPILDAFYSPRDNLVRTLDSMALERWLGGGMGGGGGDGIGGSPRSNFPDTAQWFPTLHTDANGEVTVRFNLPDSLTRWRLTAKAATQDTRVGEARAHITTHQEIIVRPILPRTLTAGDTVQISALVHNYGREAQEIVVFAQTDNTAALRFQSSLTQTIQLQPGQVGMVGWLAQARAAGQVQVVVRARTQDQHAGDAVSLPLPIRPLSIPDVSSQIGQFGSEFSTTIQLPADALGISTVRIELSRSIAGSMLQGLEYLTGFPYGCVEQTMSRALPNAVVGRAMHKLGLINPTLLADLPALINASVQRLYGYQHNDGGWGWWYDDATDAYQTAWVIFGLSVTAEAGYEIDPQVIERGAQWLQDNLSKTDLRTRALALYSLAMAGAPDSGQALKTAQSLADQINQLDTFSRAALALALHQWGDADKAQEIVNLLIETAVIGDDGTVAWTGERYDGHYHEKTMSSSIRSTALALTALIRLRPQHALEPGIIHWLMSQRRTEGWGSTNETSFTLLALTDHLLAAQQAMSNATFRIELNHTVMAQGSLGAGEPAFSLDIPAAQMRVGDNVLRIYSDGSQPLYYVIASRLYLAQSEIAAAGVVQVQREYLDPQSNTPVTDLKTGQLVRVRLTVNMPRQAAYIIVEDKLPGGLEALNEKLNNTSHIVQDYQEPRYDWESFGYNYKEVRADRVSFFITEVKRGTRTFTYMARVTHAGHFVALPAEVWGMYSPNLWGRSSSTALDISLP